MSHLEVESKRGHGQGCDKARGNEERPSAESIDGHRRAKSADQLDQANHSRRHVRVDRRPSLNIFNH